MADARLGLARYPIFPSILFPQFFSGQCFVCVEKGQQLAVLYVCMYVKLHSRTHKDIDTSNNRDQLNSERHVLVQAAVTTQLCHHTWHLPQRQRTGNQTSHLGSGTTNPHNQSDCNISP